jgi:hypothetical protein
MAVFQGNGSRAAGSGRRAKTASASVAAPGTDARARRRRLERRKGEVARWPEVRRRAWHWSAWEADLHARRRERSVGRATAGQGGRIDQAWPLQTLTKPSVAV